VGRLRLMTLSPEIRKDLVACWPQERGTLKLRLPVYFNPNSCAAEIQLAKVVAECLEFFDPETVIAEGKTY